VTAAVGTAVHDVDVHHGWARRADLAPYLSADPVHQERFLGSGLGAGVRMSGDKGVRGWREDALADGKPPEGRAVVTASPELVREQLLDGCGVEWALLTGGQMYATSCHPDSDYANALSRAFNDFTTEQWLAADSRLRCAITVNARDPEWSAAEIRRMAAERQVVAVLLPGGSLMPYGQRFYRPIHEACVEHDLVLAIHYGTEGTGVNPPPTPVGFPSRFAEASLMRANLLQVHFSSFIFEGVFERLPGLKLLMLEGGFTWVPPYLWHLDQTWAEVRIQTPWVSRYPSEYVIESVRVGSRPFDGPTPDGPLLDVLEWMEAGKTLLFASDYPRWDWTDPATTFEIAPAPLRERILAGNATDFFRS
jgi:predicted TIM-barrel fold metal-dependent hydrolase